MWEALAAAKTALERGDEFEVQCAVENLRVVVHGTLTRAPLSEPEQAIEDEITAERMRELSRNGK